MIKKQKRQMELISNELIENVLKNSFPNYTFISSKYFYSHHYPILGEKFKIVLEVYKNPKKVGL